MALPNAKELIVLEKFRNIVQDLDLNDEQKNDDMFLIAWLRARDLDLNKAYEMLRKYLEWRKENDIENILSWKPPSNFSKEFPYEICGETSDGCPILVAPFGKWDIRKAVESGYREDWLKYIDYILGQLIYIQKQNTIKLKRPVTQGIILLNFDEFPMRQLASFSNLNTILEFVRRYESNYPEILRTCYVVNASRVFTLLFKCVKPLLSARTLSKVIIYGTNKIEWKKVLLENIPADQLLEEYGGTMIIEQKQNKQSEGMKLNPGNEIIKYEEFKTTTIKPGSRFSVELHVEHEQTLLSWKFKTDDYDIGFLILQNDEKEIYSYLRLDSHVEEQEGVICCESIGKYSIIFDNTHSRLRGKKLYYLIESCSPDSKESQLI